jgi:penicillin-binding protein 1A
VVKNFLLTNERTVERKVREILLAHRIEQTLTKDEILELYLNEIFLGQNSYGMAAASMTYFNTPLAEVTLPQAAYLVSLPKSPSNLHPVNNRDRALERRAYVLDQMVRNGYITQAQADAAKADPFHTVQSGDIRSYRADIPPRAYFTDEIRRQAEEALGKENVVKGGLEIEATIDHAMQAAAERALRDGLLRLDRQAGVWRGTGRAVEVAPSQANRTLELAEWGGLLAAEDIARDVEGWMAAVVVRVDETGAFVVFEEGVRPTVGFIPSSAARDWPLVQGPGASSPVQATRLSDLVQPYDLIHVEHAQETKDGFPVLALRQIPAVEGAFLAADVRTGRILAMQGGFSFERSEFNRATQALRQTGSSFKPFLYAAALERGETAASVYEDVPKTIRVGTQTWTPKNASGRSYGTVTMRTAMERSLNLATLDIGQSVGMDAIVEMAERLGVYDEMKRFPANMLGSQETTLFDMVRAYAAFASGGEWVDLSLVERIVDRKGRTLFELVPDGGVERQRVLPAVVAYQMTDMLKGVIQGGTGSRIKLPDPVAGKTGTTNDAQDVWFVGYTPTIVAGCYIGFDRPQPLGPGAGGGSICGPVFEAFMVEAMAAYPGGDFAVPEGGAYVGFNSAGRRVQGDGARREFAAVDPDVLQREAVEAALVEAGEGVAVVEDWEPGAALPVDAPPIAMPGGGVPILSPSERAKADRDRFLSIGSGGLY